MCVFEPKTRPIGSVLLSFKRDLSNDLKRFRKKRFAEFGSETLSSGKRFALVHSSIPFALGRIHVKLAKFHL